MKKLIGIIFIVFGLSSIAQADIINATVHNYEVKNAKKIVKAHKKAPTRPKVYKKKSIHQAKKPARQVVHLGKPSVANRPVRTSSVRRQQLSKSHSLYHGSRPVREAHSNFSGGPLQLNAQAVAVVNANNKHMLYGKNSNQRMSIASITKLMMAMVVLDAKLPMNQTLQISSDDIDRIKRSASRLPVGTNLTRHDMLLLALMSSENRAASALARYYPGGRSGFVRAMNAKARMLGMWNTHFVESTGLNPLNVSTPIDLAKMVSAAFQYSTIREFTTTKQRDMQVGRRSLHYVNSNALVRNDNLDVYLSKTGYIREAGHCVIMRTMIHNQPVNMVIMHSSGNGTRSQDALRITRWLEGNYNANYSETIAQTAEDSNG